MEHLKNFLSADTLAALVYGVIERRIGSGEKPELTTPLMAALTQVIERGCLLDNGAANFTRRIIPHFDDWPVAKNAAKAVLENQLWPALSYPVMPGASVALADATLPIARAAVVAEVLAGDLTPQAMAEAVAFFPHATGRQVMEMVAQKTGLTHAEIKKRLDGLKMGMLKPMPFLVRLPADALAPAAAFLVSSKGFLSPPNPMISAVRLYFAAGEVAARSMPFFLKTAQEVEEYQTKNLWLPLYYLFTTKLVEEDDAGLLQLLDMVPYTCVMPLLTAAIELKMTDQRPMISYLAMLAAEKGRDFSYLLALRHRFGKSFNPVEWYDEW